MELPQVEFYIGETVLGAIIWEKFSWVIFTEPFQVINFLNPFIDENIDTHQSVFLHKYS